MESELWVHGNANFPPCGRVLGATLAGLTFLALGGCADVARTQTGPEPTSVAEELINSDGLLAHIRVLASDEFEGRSPGTVGETRTIEYLDGQFRALGLKPAAPDGSFHQEVPLTGHRSSAQVEIDVGGQPQAQRIPEDMVAWSYARAPEMHIEKSDLVFVGYGVIAPEYGWDDYKGQDLRGKTLVMLINDPQIPDPNDPARLDESMFKGKAMTYYGRWTYKFEMAARLGAAAAIIVHETAMAAYPYSVVVNSNSGENFDINTGQPNPDFPPVAAWMSNEAARRLFASTGRDFDELKRSALRRDFHPVPLGARASFTVHNTWHDLHSANAVAWLEGSDPSCRNEVVVISAHWDHFGWNPALPGSKHEQIFHGALDNASGVGALLEIARAFRALPQAPRRSILFLATTAEERGLLGARYYVDHPLAPLIQTAADINIDMMNPWGRTHDVEIVGYGNSTLEDLASGAARAQGRVTVPEAHPERGSFYRADHFEFAKAGVPALYLGLGREFPGHDEDFGDRMRNEFTALRYHKVTDTVDSQWDLSGAVDDTRLMFRVARIVADTGALPQWRAGAEFARNREESLRRFAQTSAAAGSCK